MGSGDLELVRRHVEAWTGGNPESALEYMHPDVEYDTTLRPDGEVWRGREGVRRAMSEWVSTWEDYAVHADAYLDAGEGRVVLLWSESGRAKASGVLAAEQGATVYTVRDGMVSSAVVSVDREGTLAALGLGAAPAPS